MHRLIGYARTSTKAQDISIQLAILEEHGCHAIFTDAGKSGCTANRPGLTALYNEIRSGDRVLCWRLDRLGRDRYHLMQIESDFRSIGVTIRTIADDVDTATAEGQVRFAHVASLADFEKQVLSARIREALARKKISPDNRGRPLKLSQEHVVEIRERLVRGGITRAEIAASYDVSVRTLFRYLQA